jgi:uncharacterized protein YbjQ (UPF0145 family)
MSKQFGVVSVPCPHCRHTSESSSPGDLMWDCPNCTEAYFLRRCSHCAAVSHVTVMQQRGVEWACVWCKAFNTGFRRRDPAAVTVGALAADVARLGLKFEPLVSGQPAADTQPMLIVTTNEIPGYQIVRVHGDVFGLTVRAANYFSNLGAQFAGIAGGEASGYTKLLTDSRHEARARLWREARALGANAIVAMRFDCNSISNAMSEIAAYGTAVTVSPDPASLPAASSGVSPTSVTSDGIGA